MNCVRLAGSRRRPRPCGRLRLPAKRRGISRMASYRGHLSFAAVLGAGYGCWAAVQLDTGWGPPLLGAGLTTLGGMLPDLDSDSGVPVRMLFGVAAAAVPFLLFQR